MAKSKLTKYERKNSSSEKFTGLLDIERIKKNPLYKCTIGSTQSGTGFSLGITGIYNPDAPFSISVGSEYVDQFELPFDSSKLNSVINLAANMSDKSQFIFKSLRMTEQRWNGSTSPTFITKLDIPIVRKTDACWSVLKYLLRATAGTLNEYRGGGQVQRAESAFQIFAPNGYRIQYSGNAKSADTPKGTYVVALGSGKCNWFLMPNALVTNMDFAIGSKKYYDGNPTSVTCTIQYKFWRYPLYEDMIEWFPLMNKGGYN